MPQLTAAQAGGSNVSPFWTCSHGQREPTTERNRRATEAMTLWSAARY